MEETNPLKSDGELQILLGKLDRVKKYNTFQRWKGKFLARFEEFLYDKGMDPAEQACTDMETLLKKMVLKTTKVLDFIEKGDLGEEKKTVKASLALNEMCTTLEKTRLEIETLVPSLKSDEKRKGFSKFHLGAALIRQGFHQYVSMKAVEDAVVEIGQKLQHVADRQQLDLFYYYKTQVKRFCDVMADLDLYMVMLKCVEFLEPPEESESEDPDYVNIVVKTPDDDQLLKMEVDTKETVGGIKTACAAGAGIPVPKQVLKFKDDTLDDNDKTMEDLGIEDGAVFTVEKLKIPITVNAPGGKSIELVVDPDMYVSDLKRQLEPESGIPGNNQCLKKGDDELDDPTKTLEACGIEAGDNLDLEPKTIKINVNMPDNSKLELDIAPSDDTNDIKDKIEKASGFMASRQVLKKDGEALATDGTTSKDMGITEGSTIDVEIFTVPITVKNWDGTDIPLQVEPSQSLQSIKEMLEQKSGIQTTNQNLSLDGKELTDNEKSATDNEIVEGVVLDLEPKVFSVQVEMPDGNKEEIALTISDTDEDIKKKIEEQTGMVAQRQVVKHEGDELPPGKSAREIGLKEGSPLKVDIFKIPVTVKNWDGTEIPLEVEPSQDLASLKRMVEPESGIVTSNQALSKDGSELAEDEKTISENGIVAGDVIDLEPKTINVKVDKKDGETIDLEVALADTDEDIKKKIEEKTGMAVPRQVLKQDGEELPTGKSVKDMGLVAGDVIDLEPKTINVKVDMPSGETLDVEVALADTDEDIKKKIEEKTGMAVPRQVLKQDGEELPTGKSAKEMDLKEGSTLTVEVLKVPVKVRNWDGSEIDIMVDPTEELASIKKLVEPESGIPVDNQLLSMEAKALSDDSKPAAEYGIQADSILDLEPKTVKVSVEMPEGDEKEVEISPSDNGEEIKKKIEAATGLQVPRQVLKFDDEEIPDTGKTARDLGIREGSKLKAGIFKIPVTVKTWDGKDISIMVEPSDKLISIKVQVEPESGIPISNQSISLRGNLLNDNDQTATDYGIQAGSVLNLEPKTVKVNVKMPNGEIKEIEIEPADDSATIKRKIEEQTGMEAPRQMLKIDEKELPEKTAARDMGIREGTSIDVEIFKVPVTVNNWDGRTFEIMVDPTDKLVEIKKSLEPDSGIPVKNQVLSMTKHELQDDNKRANSYGIQAGSVLELEPLYISVTVEMPDGSTCKLDVTASETGDDIKDKVAKDTGIANIRQVLKFNNKEMKADFTVKGMGMKDGSIIQCSLFKIPITVETKDGKTIPMEIEPVETLGGMKKLLEKDSGLPAKKQVIKFIEKELDDDKKTITSYGIKKGSVVYLEPKDDPIVFVDVKCGVLFGVDRDDVIEKGMLTPNQGNPMEFNEAEKSNFSKEKILKAMLDSPNLGVKPQIVVEKAEVDDYDLQEAEQVKSKWGVKLKKRQKDRRGEELIFVDIKTEAFGLLDRQKYIQDNLITPKGNGKDETLEEAEHNQQIYDKYVTSIRNIFGVKTAT